MTTPAVLRGEPSAVYEAVAPADRGPEVEIFYATDREQADTGDEDLETEVGYGNRRGQSLVLGTAQVKIGNGGSSWPDLVEASLASERDSALPLSVVGARPLGRLNDSIFFLDPAFGSPEVVAGQEAFARDLNARLAGSRGKDLYVFVSPFKHSFDDSVVVAGEFYHYLVRDGAFIAYSWPSDSSVFSYFSAVENAQVTVRNLREFIQFLVFETEARQIHFMTYSAGARVLSSALHDLRLQNDDLGETALREKFRIGQIIFAGPDMDSGMFRNHYQDGIADLAERITIYTSSKDRALKTARFFWGGERLGATQSKDLLPQTVEFLGAQEQTNIVKVSNAERADLDNAHGYYRESPWVSSDILLIFRCGLAPRNRGLVRDSAGAFWRFPDDYDQIIGAYAEKHCPFG